MAKGLISDRFGPKAVARPDMLNSFIRHGVPQSELVSESLLQIIAGSDTTATAIRATLLYIMTHPPCYRALQEEIDTAIRAGRVSSPVKDAEARQLPYLQAVIKEGMRIWPPATALQPKVVPPGGDAVEVDGRSVFVPGGTGIGYCVWGLQHSKDVFGDDADDFRPERWLIAEGDRMARMLRTIELIWGYGKYQCLGKNVAMMELNKVFVEVCFSLMWAKDERACWLMLCVAPS